MMEQDYGIPILRVSYFGVEDMAESLYAVARHFGDPAMLERTRVLVHEELSALMPELERIKKKLRGKKAAIYVGGAFKVFSLLWTTQSLRTLAATLSASGHKIGHVTVGNLLVEQGYSLQGNKKTLEGSSYPDRDAQFQFIACTGKSLS